MDQIKDAQLIGLKREEKSSAPSGIQTHNISVMKRVLYSVAQCLSVLVCVCGFGCVHWSGKRKEMKGNQTSPEIATANKQMVSGLFLGPGTFWKIL